MGNFKERCADLDLIYKTANGLKLPIQVFLPDADVHKAQAVLAIHGGGWNDAIKDNSKWNGSRMAKNVHFSNSGNRYEFVTKYFRLTYINDNDQFSAINLYADIQGEKWYYGKQNENNLGGYACNIGRGVK